MASVLIGIPTLNGPDRLRRCLASIQECAGPHNVRVLVADDGSTDANLKLNKDVVSVFSGVEILYGHGRTGIAATWNRLTRHDTSREVVILVNDDIEVVPDWLDVLVFSILENPCVGMVGLNTYCGVIKRDVAPTPRIDYAEAHLLHAGGKLVASHGPIFAFHRNSFNEVGGFDERYFCFYEEVDFGVALKKKGYFHFMASYPICYHMGGATNSDPKNLDAARYMTESKAKFSEKWRETVNQMRQGFTTIPTNLREWSTQFKVWKE